MEAAASGIGSFILGIILKAAGFNSELATQTDLANTWIFNCSTIVPIVFVLIMMVAIYKYPLTREKHREILGELAKKEKN